MDTGNWYNQKHILELLYGLGGSWPVEASQCLRIGCTESTGLYWCNDNAWGIRTKGWYLHSEAKRVLYQCCKYSVLQGPDYAVAGMASFPDDSKEASFSRVVLGYADCHDPLDTDPLKYGYPGDEKACKETGPPKEGRALVTRVAVL
ncbi:hypothetical protein B0T14DRAFT_519292 [Immersiella caudata]|uniref:Uncharacterized protein n=1 Tax=Immersiella caudata TaxID=314043 RepID=A0AA39WPZ7_9PEZI|nr:hypothetical protein B0T14DRAFT_519292 [Immersiella caudata]